MTTDFQAFPKIPRLYKDITITEKLDGSNAQILIAPSPNHGIGERMPNVITRVHLTVNDVVYDVFAGSRNRWLAAGGKDDNFGFGAWVQDNAVALVEILGEGRHFGEWWGNGIQRGYGLPKGDRRLSLFNVGVWDWLSDYEARLARTVPPELCVVPTLYRGPYAAGVVEDALQRLRDQGSAAVPFMSPEGMMVYHEAAKQYFKVPLDTEHKSNARR